MTQTKVREGIFEGKRTETKCDVKTGELIEKETHIRIILTKVSKCQYNVKQINLEKDEILELLCFNTKEGLLVSSSLGGIDHFYIRDCLTIDHYWSIPETPSGFIINAFTTLDFVDRIE